MTIGPAEVSTKICAWGSLLNVSKKLLPARSATLERDCTLSSAYAPGAIGRGGSDAGGVSVGRKIPAGIVFGQATLKLVVCEGVGVFGNVPPVTVTGG
jgi:hypothetical protein